MIRKYVRDWFNLHDLIAMRDTPFDWFLYTCLSRLCDRRRDLSLFGGRRESERERMEDRGLQITLWSAINGDVIATIGEPAARRFTYALCMYMCSLSCAVVSRNKMHEKRLGAYVRSRAYSTDTKCCRRIEQKKKQRTLRLFIGNR